MFPSISETLVVYENTTNTLQLSNSSEQWKISLQEVKLLYLQRQYKQCAAKATKLLRKVDGQSLPIHKAFLHYYSAISYETLGQAAHKYSSNKLPLLNLVKDNLVACKSSLTAALSKPKEHPQLQPPRRKPSNRKREHVSMNEKRNTYPATSPTKLRRDDDTALIENAVSHAAPSPEPAQQPTTSDKLPRQGQKKKNELMPSPLRIHKVYYRGGQVQSMVEWDPPSSPPPTRPLPELPAEAYRRPSPQEQQQAEEATISLYRPLAPQFYRHSIATGPRPRSRNNSSNHSRNRTNQRSPFPLPANSPLIPLIASLSAQLDANILSITTRISQTHELQRAHKSKKKNRLASFWSFTPTYDDDGGGDNDGDNGHNHGHGYGYGYSYNYTNNYSHGAGGAGGFGSRNSSGASTTSSSINGIANINGCTSSSSPLAPTSATNARSSPSPSDESRQQRIARLKAEGWKTVGLRSRERGWKGAEYYERLCNEALAELYGKGRAG
ncbi:hypothetical protein AJ79_00803 [Helicocarpus griseus UAMH5409]|uniref:Uncharacterized protein n=1 Tax=Helicocarpus griseus UAMH5409 TaxID=1447875 RepID=A0A2B7Y1F5_9EURO|nr:hypothetical protein AJ79_00803 [Helicocarpus griseus UAMH5409]